MRSLLCSRQCCRRYCPRPSQDPCSRSRGGRTIGFMLLPKASMTRVSMESVMRARAPVTRPLHDVLSRRPLRVQSLGGRRDDAVTG